MYKDLHTDEAKIYDAITGYFTANPEEMFCFLCVTDSGGKKLHYRITNSKLMPYAEAAHRIIDTDLRDNAVRTVEIRNRPNVNSSEKRPG